MITDSVKFGPVADGEDLDDLARGDHRMCFLDPEQELFVDYGGEPLVYVAKDPIDGVWLVFDAGKPHETLDLYPLIEEQHFYYLWFGDAISLLAAIAKDGIPTRTVFSQCSRSMRFVYTWTMFRSGFSGDHNLTIETIDGNEMPDFDRVRDYLLSLAPDDLE